MDFRILGSVEVLAEGRPLPIGGPRQRALLASRDERCVRRVTHTRSVAGS